MIIRKPVKLNNNWKRYRRIYLFILIACTAMLYSCATLGEVEKKEHEHGNYQLYVPESYTFESKLLVVVHGTPLENQNVNELARTFIDRWTDFAEETSTIIIAPAFDQENFASHSGAFGGYRGLYGRNVGSDEFLHQILAEVNLLAPTSEHRFFLYGHSAGGQFANRYVVRHPDRVLGVVLSAPGRYAFPDESASWHFGMGSVNREITWPDSEEKHINIQPDPAGWIQAASLPITIVIGTQDTSPQPCRVAHCADGMTETTRIAIGVKWMMDMNSLAASEGNSGGVDIELVPGVGHNSAALTEKCQEVIRNCMD